MYTQAYGGNGYSILVLTLDSAAPMGPDRAVIRCRRQFSIFDENFVILSSHSCDVLPSDLTVCIKSTPGQILFDDYADTGGWRRHVRSSCVCLNSGESN